MPDVAATFLAWLTLGTAVHDVAVSPEDVDRFPAAAEVLLCREAPVAEYRRWLQNVAPLRYWQRAELEAEGDRVTRAVEAWRSLDNAMHTVQTVPGGRERRCEHLQSLRRLLGDENYRRGRMPELVPIQWYER